MATTSNQRRPRRDSDGLVEKVVKINRCATVVKGGRRFSFSALVVVGDRRGRVGYGYGKANEVPNAIEKAFKKARDAMAPIAVTDRTIPHEVIGRFGASRVVLKPAGKGTGIVAGNTVRAVVEAAGIYDIMSKSLGSTNPVNLVKAVMQGLNSLRTREDVMRLRGVHIAPAHGNSHQPSTGADEDQSAEPLDPSATGIESSVSAELVDTSSIVDTSAVNSSAVIPPQES